MGKVPNHFIRLYVNPYDFKDLALSSFSILIIFNPSRLGCTNTYASSLPLDKFLILFGNSRGAKTYLLDAPLLTFDGIKK